MSELKSCPLCGSTNLQIHFRPLENRNYVMCHSCHLQSRLAPVESAAIKDWNTRPIEDALRAKLAAAEKLIAALEQRLKLDNEIRERNKWDGCLPNYMEKEDAELYAVLEKARVEWEALK